MPFFALEGNAMDWIGKYICYHNVYIASNAPEMVNEVKAYLKAKTSPLNYDEIETHERVIYLPNYYPKADVIKPKHVNRDVINISCFGAIRPLKNHLLQAFAAIKLAERIGKSLHFHINGNRVEQKGEPVLKNLIGLFDNLHAQGHKLILHDWLPKEDFLELCSKMDIALQCSFSETFNIVGADAVSQGVPLVGSKEIPWLNASSTADPTKSEEIYSKLVRTYGSLSKYASRNQKYLNAYTAKAQNIWLKYFKSDCN
jgi:hypothetical protein